MGRQPSKLPSEAIWVVLLLLLVAFPVPSTETLAQPGSSSTARLEVVASDYVGTPSTIFGRGGTVYVKLTDRTRDTSPFPESLQGLVRVKATNPDATGTEVVQPGGAAAFTTLDLLESGPTSGEFTGSFRVTDVEDPSGGLVWQAPQTVVYPQAAGGSLYGKVLGDGVLSVVPGGKIVVTVPNTSLKDEVVWKRSATAVVVVRHQEPLPPGTPDPLTAGHQISGYATALRFFVTDADLNTDPFTAQVHVNRLRVFSDSDPFGEFVPLSEIVAGDPFQPSKDSEAFFGSIGFESTFGPTSGGNGKLFVRHGDRVRAVHTDTTDAAGRERLVELPASGPDPLNPSAHVSSWRFRSTEEGSLAFDLSETTSVDGDADGVYDDAAVLVANDPEAGLPTAGAEEVTAMVQADLDNTVKSLPLMEIGGLSGRFAGDVVLAKPVSEGGPADAVLDARFVPSVCKCTWVRVVSGSRIAATYAEPTDARGIPRIREATNRFLMAEEGRPILGPTDATGSTHVGRLTGLDVFGHSHDVQVFDGDANRNPDRIDLVAVRIQSTTDPVGVALVLQETATGGGTAENSGYFLGTYQFTGGPSGSGRIQVADRDLVVAEYVDARRPDGFPGTVRSPTVIWRAPTDGKVFLDAANYAKRSMVSLGGAVDFQQRVGIVAIDADQNDPVIQDHVSLLLTETLGLAGATYDAIELGVDSGIFVAQVPLGSGGTDALGVARFDPGPTFGTIVGEYVDSMGADGRPRLFRSAPAEWHTGIGSSLIRFEFAPPADDVVPGPVGRGVSAVYHVADACTTATMCPDQDLVVDVAFYGEQAANSRTVEVESLRCFDDHETDTDLDGATVTLTRNGPAQGGNTNRFSNDLRITRVAESLTTVCHTSDRIAINEPSAGSIDILHICASSGCPEGEDDPSQDLHVRARRPESIFSVKPDGGPADREAFGSFQAGHFLAAGGVANTNRGGVEIAVFDAYQIDAASYRYQSSGGSLEPVPPSPVFSIESGPDTGIFLGSFHLSRAQLLRRGNSVTPTSPDRGLLVSRAPFGAVCFFDENMDGSLGSAETIYLKVGNVCSQVGVGDLRITSGSVVSPSDAEVSVPDGQLTPQGRPANTPLRQLNPANNLGAYLRGRVNRNYFYFDVNFNGQVNVGDVRLTYQFDVDGDQTAAAYSRVSTSTARPLCDDDNCGAADVVRKVGEEFFFDANADLGYGYHDMVAVRFSSTPPPTNGALEVGDLRLTPISGVEPGRVFMENRPTETADNQAVFPGTWRVAGGLVFENAARTAVSKPGHGYWYDVQTAILKSNAAFGVGQIIVQATDDRLAGMALREMHLGTGATRYVTNAASMETQSSAVYSDATELRVLTTDQGGYKVASSDHAREPIVDRNLDGEVDCRDVEVRGATCRSVVLSADRTEATVNVACPTLGPCRIDVTYRYRAASQTAATIDDATQTCCRNRYNYVPEALGPRFGAPIPFGENVYITYRPADIFVPVRSVNGGETELVKMVYKQGQDLVFRYNGTISLEPTPQPNNGRLFVKPGDVPSDRVVIAYGDTFLSDGRPGGSIETHFRSILHLQNWFLTADAEIRFSDPAIVQPESAVFQGPYVPVEIRDVDSDRTPQHDLLFAHARDAAQASDEVHIRLRETEAHSGVFRGVVPVVSGGTELSDRIELPGGRGLVSLAFADPRGVTGRPLTIEDTIDWRPTTSAVLALEPSLPASTCHQFEPGSIRLRGNDCGLVVTIADADANLNQEVREEITLVASSLSDPAGEVIRLVETGGNTGVFRSASIRFETSATPDNGRVFAPDLLRTGEEILLRYEDPLNAQGVEETFQPPERILRLRTFDGTIAFDQPFFIGLEGQGTSGTLSRASLFVADGDLNRNPGLPDRTVLGVGLPEFARFHFAQGSTVGPDVCLELFETGANTGTMLGTLTFTSGATTPTPPCPGSGGANVAMVTADLARLSAAGAGETLLLQAAYEDRADERGLTQFLTEETDWLSKGVGVLRFDRLGYADRALKPVLTLWDADLDTSPTTRNTGTVRIRSSAHPEGVRAILTETNVATGVFRGEVVLSEDTSRDASSSTPATLEVDDRDTLVVVYEDASPAARRTRTAVIAIGDLLPPTTSVTTQPAAPDGLRGVFVMDPLITLVADEPVEATRFRVDDQGTTHVYEVPFRLAERFGEGTHRIKFWSVDVVGNTEAQREIVLTVDISDPSHRVAGLVAVPAARGAVRLDWTPAPLVGDPLEVFDYVVFRDGNESAAIGNTSLPTFLDASLTDERPHSYRVAVRDQAGRRGALSDLVSVTPDRTAPTLTAGVVLPDGFDVRNPPAALQVRVSVGEATAVKVMASVLLPSGASLTSVALAAAIGQTYQGALPTTPFLQPCLCTVNFTATDLAGNAGHLSVPLRVTGPDTERPMITLPGLPANSQVPRGSPLKVRVTDNVGLFSVRYVLNNESSTPVAVLPAEAPTLQFDVATTDLVFGAHTLLVEATDTAVDANGTRVPNVQSERFNFTIVQPPLGPIVGPPVPPGTSFFLPTTARRNENGTVAVAWALPDTLDPANVAGYQVWRAASPFVLLANLTNPEAREYLDTSSVADRVYRYVVTYFTPTVGPFAALAEVPGYPGSDEQVTHSGLVPRSERGVPGWLGIAMVAFAVVAVVVLLAAGLEYRRSAMSRRVPTVVPAEVEALQMSPGPMGPGPAEGAAGPSVGPVRRIRCPTCGARFQVAGPKPIVTECTNCGQKGILR